MADETPLAGLLDRAGNVFSLAGKLGRAFHEEGQSRAIFFDPTIWQRHAPTFNEFCAALLDLREPMQNPPDGFGPVAPQLMQAAKLAKGIRDTLARDGGFTAYLDFFPDLNTVCQAGWEAVKQVTKARRLDDPFAFVDEPITPAFSLLDRFPATPAGHVAFLEWVRDEVHNAAEAKRGQLERGYSNATIESMVRGIKWPEAANRLSALSDLPADVVEQAARVLRRELTPGTVEHIDELLTPAVRALRDEWEYRDLAQAGVMREQTCFDALVGEVLYWRNGVLPFYWSGTYHPGDFQRRTTNPLRRCLVWLDARGFQHLSARLQTTYDTALSCVADLDKKYDQHPAPADATESDSIVGDRLLPCYDKTIELVDLLEDIKRTTADVPNNGIPSKGIKAGEAFRRMMETDPETRAGWERARERLQAFAKAMQEAMDSPEYKAAQEAERQRWRELAETIQANLEWAGGELAARHFTPPESIEDWEHLARIVEIPADTIRTGNLTPREIFACALAWADRQTIKAKLAGTSGLQSEPTNAQGAATPKRRGRKKADYATVQKEAELAANWDRARDAGIYKPDFAKDNKLTVKQLDALLDRVAKRKRASE